MTGNFWEGETYAIVKAMRATGNRPGVIAQWKDRVENWAQGNTTDLDAAAVLAWLPYWHPRPFYTAEELAPIWPALAIAVGHTCRWPSVLKSARRLEFELDYAGLPRLPSFTHFFIVERIPFWSAAAYAEVEREFHAHR